MSTKSKKSSLMHKKLSNKSVIAILAVFAVVASAIVYFFSGTFAANPKLLIAAQKSDVTFHIINACNGTGKAGVSVTIKDNTDHSIGLKGTTDANGDVTIYGIPYGTYRDYISAQNYRNTIYSFVTNQPTQSISQTIYQNTMAVCSM